MKSTKDETIKDESTKNMTLRRRGGSKGYQVVLACARPGATRQDAITGLVRELRSEYGIPHADDLGFEKVWEWSSGETGEDLTLQLLLMAARRADAIGWDLDTVISLLRASRHDS